MTEREREELARLREEVDILIRILWDMRGQAKAMNNRIERELDKAFTDYLERQKMV